MKSSFFAVPRHRASPSASPMTGCGEASSSGACIQKRTEKWFGGYDSQPAPGDNADVKAGTGRMC